MNTTPDLTRLPGADTGVEAALSLLAPLGAAIVDRVVTR